MKLEKQLFTILFLLIAFTLFTSCECNRTAKGQIIDEITQLPIDSVVVEGLTISFYKTLSDSTGNYFIATKTTGAVKGCPEYKVSYSKEGYQTKVVINPGERIIYLQPE